MLRKLFTLAAAAMMSVSAFATDFKQGAHYEVLSHLQKSEQPQVTELFSFYCPHCYRYEQLIGLIKANLPEDATLEKNHVSFMGGPMGKSMSKAYATAVELDVEDTIVPAMFAAIHDTRTAPNNDKEMRQFFIDNGVSAPQFDATFYSEKIEAIANGYDAYFQQTGLTGVPAVIVNNQYLVMTGEIRSADEYVELIQFLLAK
uniref:thiol:disulfide interchange protein DsbA/DsbL n=1 Tax=Thaumasiovibrio occultus TaxID=1891184 RepID=UPI000B36462B|nr:thiol:disulfide interchange protein DsbA/DsbL [Thaumasiovibrio occultus]